MGFRHVYDISSWSPFWAVQHFARYESIAGAYPTTTVVPKPRPSISQEREQELADQPWMGRWLCIRLILSNISWAKTPSREEQKDLTWIYRSKKCEVHSMLSSLLHTNEAILVVLVVSILFLQCLRLPGASHHLCGPPPKFRGQIFAR